MSDTQAGGDGGDWINRSCCRILLPHTTQDVSTICLWERVDPSLHFVSLIVTNLSSFRSSSSKQHSASCGTDEKGSKMFFWHNARWIPAFVVSQSPRRRFWYKELVLQERAQTDSLIYGRELPGGLFTILVKWEKNIFGGKKLMNINNIYTTTSICWWFSEHPDTVTDGHWCGHNNNQEQLSPPSLSYKVKNIFSIHPRQCTIYLLLVQAQQNCNHTGVTLLYIGVSASAWANRTWYVDMWRPH